MFFYVSNLPPDDVVILVRGDGVVDVPPDGTLVPVYDLVGHTHVVGIMMYPSFCSVPEKSSKCGCTDTAVQSFVKTQV